jgi:mannan endo-1,4-beta-mannosidase
MIVTLWRRAHPSGGCGNRKTPSRWLASVAVLCLVLEPISQVVRPVTHVTTPSIRLEAARVALGDGGFIRRDGRHLVLAGSTYRFTGLNIYNANSRNNCWYSLGAGRALKRSLHTLGPAQNVFRAWFFQSEATTNGKRDWSAFDHTLKVAKRAGDRVIPVLINQWGQCETWTDYAAGYKTEAWYRLGYKTTPTSPGMPDTYRAWVRHVVTRYRDNPTILAWQMVNEAEDKTSYGGGCSPTAGPTLRTFAADISALIKSIDPNHLVSIGTIGSGQCGSAGAQYETLHALRNVDLCEYHDYSTAAMPGDQWNGLETRIAQCHAVGKPLFVGESGVKTSASRSPKRRAALFGRKLTAQFDAGVVGELLWDWRNARHGGTASAGYEIGPHDPALDVLARH